MGLEGFELLGLRGDEVVEAGEAADERGWQRRFVRDGKRKDFWPGSGWAAGGESYRGTICAPVGMRVGDQAAGMAGFRLVGETLTLLEGRWGIAGGGGLDEERGMAGLAGRRQQHPIQWSNR